MFIVKNHKNGIDKDHITQRFQFFIFKCAPCSLSILTEPFLIFSFRFLLFYWALVFSGTFLLAFLVPFFCDSWTFILLERFSLMASYLVSLVKWWSFFVFFEGWSWCMLLLSYNCLFLGACGIFIIKILTVFRVYSPYLQSKMHNSKLLWKDEKTSQKFIQNKKMLFPDRTEKNHVRTNILILGFCL